MDENSVIVVGTVSDDPFAIDVAHFFNQYAEIADLISLKSFANSEFCPRFISDEEDMSNIGRQLAGKTVVMVSTCCGGHTRNALAMRCMLVARAAKDNGAARVILVQPDLFYSAQDRGPRVEHGRPEFERSQKDFKKFDGQPFSARLYADLLKLSGVDEVVTVHNHSVSVNRLFSEVFNGRYFNLCPSEIFANYLMKGGFGLVGNSPHGLALCAPDGGAVNFVEHVFESVKDVSEGMLLPPSVDLLFMHKERSGERQVEICPRKDSPLQASELAGRDVVVFDDMVRTGYTIVECCRRLKEAGAAKVVFVVTHFYSSDEVKENLNTPFIDEIVTTNTLPPILNRDKQGRLRKKMLVLKIEKWIANFISEQYREGRSLPHKTLYAVDISSKNPRAREKEELERELAS